MKDLAEKRYTIETCTDTAYSCKMAVEGGCNRIELCSSLALGGLTPSASLIEYACNLPSVSIAVMIRPRCGDFLYDDDEFELMKRDIELSKELGAGSVVFGILTPEAMVDKKRTRLLVEAAEGMQVCFHRAIDMTQNIMQSMEDIIACGCHRVLTSGGFATAAEGIEVIRQMQQSFGKSIDIMVGSAVSSSNVKRFRDIGIRSFHLSGKADCESRMSFRKAGISMGATDPAREYVLSQTDPCKIAALREALNS